MEFGEKLQELRKNRNLTQEELAESLFVSRTAISKWESGRGYPSIDSLKEISAFFSVSIDDLLSGEKILDIARQENKANIRSVCDLMLGIIDLMAVILVFLPLYANQTGDEIRAVNLLGHVDRTPVVIAAYWVLIILTIMTGAVKICLGRIKVGDNQKYQKYVSGLSFTLSIITVLVMALTRQPYGVIAVFLLFVIKGVVIIMKTGIRFGMPAV